MWMWKKLIDIEKFMNGTTSQFSKPKFTDFIKVHDFEKFTIKKFTKMKKVHGSKKTSQRWQKS